MTTIKLSNGTELTVEEARALWEELRSIFDPPKNSWPDFTKVVVKPGVIQPTILIVDTHYPARYGFKLSAVDFNRNSSSTEFLVVCRPPIDRDHHFCNLACLGAWIDMERDVF